MTTKKHDIFNASTLNTPILNQLTARSNDVQPEDIDRGALGPAQLPDFDFGFSPGHTVCGGHEAIPGGDTEYFGFESYQNRPLEEVSTDPGPPPIVFPAYNRAFPVAAATGPMRVLGPNPPYGGDTNLGWSIIARTNLSTAGQCAEISVSPVLDIDVLPDFVAGRLEFDLAGYCNIGDVTGIAGGDGIGPMLGFGFGVKVNGAMFIFPRSIRMWSNRTKRDITGLRYTATIADITETLAGFDQGGQRQLQSFFYAVFVTDKHYDNANVELGNWGFSVYPVMRGDF